MTFDEQLTVLRQYHPDGVYGEYETRVAAALRELLRRWDALHNVEVTRKCSGCQVVEPRVWLVEGKRKCEACFNMGSR